MPDRESDTDAGGPPTGAVCPGCGEEIQVGQSVVRLTAGLLTIYVLLFNGLLLGAVTGVTAHYDVGFELWTFVIGHGVIELTTI